jgi:hypothetical protein
MQEHSSNNNSSQFTKTDNGFHIKFENGYTISVQFGPGNYCANRTSSFASYQSLFDDLKKAKESSKVSCKDAEIAVFTPGGEFLSLGNDQVAGWKSVDQVFRVMMCVWRHDPKNG